MPRKGQKSHARQSTLEMASSSSVSQFRDEEASQLNLSQAQKVVDKMSPEEFKRKVGDMVRYILFADNKKVGIKRADLMKFVMKDHARAFASVFEEAALQIKNVFGYEVAIMESEDGKNRGYALINQLTDSDITNFLDWKEDETKMGLLLLIVSMIFMNEGALTENSLWNTLFKFGIKKGEKHHEFNDTEKLITQEFVRQHYIERQKVTSSDGQIDYHYSLGARSLKEISKRSILEFVSEVYGVDSISAWKVQYEEVLESERPPDIEMSQAD